MRNRPEITEERIKEIVDIIECNPGLSRTKISKRICEIWDWRGVDGKVKDISCRDMLRALDKAGKIILPASKRVMHVNEKREIEHLDHDTTYVECRLSELLPVEVVPVSKGESLKEFKSLLDTYHYLGFERTVGENMKYIVRSNQGTPLACLLFGSAAWSCSDRDEYIGWEASVRKRMLPAMTNNTRFLVLPWVRVPHLASHVLSLVCRRISSDWEQKYGHGLVCCETFVEQGRFSGACYKAANWQFAGVTKGRGKDDRAHTNALPLKDIYLYPLRRDFRRRLRKGDAL